MIVSIGKLVFKDGMEKRGLDIVIENSNLGAGQSGCLETMVVQNLSSPSEVLLFSKWEDQISYTNAISNLKRNPEARKLFLKVLPYLAKQPHYESYEDLPT